MVAAYCSFGATFKFCLFLTSYTHKRNNLYVLIIAFVWWSLKSYFLSQPAVRPPAQKAKSPAPQAPGGSSALKLGPKGVFWVLLCLYLHTSLHACTHKMCLTKCSSGTCRCVTSFSLNYPCSSAASWFPVAKATGFFACSTALQTDEGKLWIFFLFFFAVDRFPAIFVFLVDASACCFYCSLVGCVMRHQLLLFGCL